MRHLLSHQAGLPVFPPVARDVGYDDREALVALLADSAPLHPPGEGVAEHALTYGHLLDEVLRRATGEPLADRFARVAGAAGWDLHLQVTDHDLPRVATVEDPDGTWASALSRRPPVGTRAQPPAGTARPGGPELRSLPADVLPSGGDARWRPRAGDVLRRRPPRGWLGGRAARSRAVARVRRARGVRTRSRARPAGHLDARLPGQRRGRTGRARHGRRRRVLGLDRTRRPLRRGVRDQKLGSHDRGEVVWEAIRRVPAVWPFARARREPRRPGRGRPPPAGRAVGHHPPRRVHRRGRDHPPALLRRHRHPGRRTRRPPGRGVLRRRVRRRHRPAHRGRQTLRRPRPRAALPPPPAVETPHSPATWPPGKPAGSPTRPCT